jgi:hypothetical protein
VKRLRRDVKQTPLPAPRAFVSAPASTSTRGAGFVGPYRFVFVRGGDEVTAEIIIRPRATVR